MVKKPELQSIVKQTNCYLVLCMLVSVLTLGVYLTLG